MGYQTSEGYQPSLTPPLGFSGSWSWALCSSQDDRSRVPSEPRSPTPHHPAVRLSAPRSVRPPALSLSPLRFLYLLPKRCFCSSSTDPTNRRLSQSRPPPSPLRWVPVPPGGASWMDWQRQAYPTPAPLGQRHRGHPTRPQPHRATRAHTSTTRAGHPHSCADVSHSRRDPQLPGGAGQGAWLEEGDAHPGWGRPFARTWVREPPHPGQVWPSGGSPLVPAMSTLQFGQRKAA